MGKEYRSTKLTWLGAKLLVLKSHSKIKHAVNIRKYMHECIKALSFSMQQNSGLKLLVLSS